jgi:hypothetical protein
MDKVLAEFIEDYNELAKTSTAKKINSLFAKIFNKDLR